MTIEPKHPNQTIVTDDQGTRRFCANAIVVHLLDWCRRNRGPDLNELATLPFSNADRRQFAQLIGYSVSGYEDLSYTQAMEDLQP